MRRTAFLRQKPAVQRLRLRAAELSDTPRLKAFYLERMRDEPAARREAFPIPTLLELTQSAELGDCLLIESLDGRKILAASGIYRLVEHDHGRFGELSGMCTAKEIGGLGPYSIQEIMLAVRVVRALFQLLDEVAPTTIVSFAAETNNRSRSNLADFGLDLTETRPEWLDGEFVSWFGWDNAGDWLTYRIGRKAVSRAVDIVREIEGSGLALQLDRADRATGERETFILHFDRNLWEAQIEDIQRIHRDGLADEPASIPPRLTFDRQKLKR